MDKYGKGVQPGILLHPSFNYNLVKDTTLGSSPQTSTTKVLD